MHVYCPKINDVDHFKQVLISCWDTISQELINAAIDQWSKRLLLVIRSQDGHILNIACTDSDVHWFSNDLYWQCRWCWRYFESSTSAAIV